MYDINNLKMNIATESAAASCWYADIDFGLFQELHSGCSSLFFASVLLNCILPYYRRNIVKKTEKTKNRKINKKLIGEFIAKVGM